jgi:hypothetical protein
MLRRKKSRPASRAWCNRRPWRTKRPGTLGLAFGIISYCSSVRPEPNSSRLIELFSPINNAVIPPQLVSHPRSDAFERTGYQPNVGWPVADSTLTCSILSGAYKRAEAA